MTDAPLEDVQTSSVVERRFEVEDITVRSDGTGRVVEAYAAAFTKSDGSPMRYEIRDSDGHYHEIIKPGAFAKTIAERGTNFSVLFNHGRAMDGRADGYLTVPIGVPVDVHEDERGVFTATEYLDNPLADAALGAIKKRAIRGQSFSGRFVKSQKQRAAKRGDLPTIYRSEVAMSEYGPVLNPANFAAEILGTRSLDAFLLDWANAEDDIARAELLGMNLPALTDLGQGQPGADAVPDEPVADHSARRQIAWNNFRASLIQKGIK